MENVLNKIRISVQAFTDLYVEALQKATSLFAKFVKRFSDGIIEQYADYYYNLILYGDDDNENTRH